MATINYISIDNMILFFNKAWFNIVRIPILGSIYLQGVECFFKYFFLSKFYFKSNKTVFTRIQNINILKS